MNSLTVQQNSPVADRGSINDVAMMKNRMVQDYPAAPWFMTEPVPADVRSRLEGRKARLEAWLAPAPVSQHPQMAHAVASLLGGFAANTGGSPQATTAKYVQVFSDLPAWATIKACQMLERGEVEGASLDFRPSAPRVRDAARELLAPWLEELATIKSILNAPALEPENAEMRERLGKLFSQFASDFRTGKFRNAAGEAER